MQKSVNVALKAAKKCQHIDVVSVSQHFKRFLKPINFGCCLDAEKNYTLELRIVRVPRILHPIL